MCRDIMTSIEIRQAAICNYSPQTAAARLLWLIGGRAVVVTAASGRRSYGRSQRAWIAADRSVLLPDRPDLRADGGLRPAAQAGGAALVAGRRAARVRRTHRLGAGLHDQRRGELLHVALRAADHRREHDSVAAQRDDGRRPQLADVRRHRRAHSTPARRWRRLSSGAELSAAAAGRVLHRRPEHLRVHGGRRAERLPRGAAAAHRRCAGAGGGSARRISRRSASTSSAA